MSTDSAEWKNLPATTPELQKTAPFPAPPGTATATQDGCQVCGRGPAEWFTVRRHVGMLFLQRFIHAKVYLCRDHAVPVIRSYLGKTLVQGWWGVISFFVNWVVVAQDLAALMRARSMPSPTR